MAQIMELKSNIPTLKQSERVKKNNICQVLLNNGVARIKVCPQPIEIK